MVTGQRRRGSSAPGWGAKPSPGSGIDVRHL